MSNEPCLCGDTACPTCGNLQGTLASDVRVKWWVEGDGYVNRGRNLHTTIPGREFEGCYTKDDRDEVVQSWLDHEFEQKITYGYDVED